MNYHVLDMVDKKNKVRVAYHIPIPNWSNKAEPDSHSLRTALVEHLTQDGGTIESVVPNFATEFSSELSDMQAGIIYEHVERTTLKNANWNDAERFSRLDIRFGRLETQIVRKLKAKLRLWGSNKNVT